MPKRVIYFVDDSKDHTAYRLEQVMPHFPEAEAHCFEDVYTAFKSEYARPDVVVVDISAVGFIAQIHHAYGPICNLMDRFSGALLVIDSAVGARAAENVKDDILERLPNLVVEIVDWSDSTPFKSLVEILQRHL